MHKQQITKTDTNHECNLTSESMTEIQQLHETYVTT